MLAAPITMKRVTTILGLAAIVIVIVSGVLLRRAQMELIAPLQAILEADLRNRGIEIEVGYDGWLAREVLVFSLENVTSAHGPEDVFRVLLDYARAMRDKRFQECQVLADLFSQPVKQNCRHNIVGWSARCR